MHLYEYFCLMLDSDIDVSGHYLRRQEMYVQCDIKARSRNHCCRTKAIVIEYSKCVCVCVCVC
jgi:hypothetical protein